MTLKINIGQIVSDEMVTIETETTPTTSSTPPSDTSLMWYNTNNRLMYYYVPSISRRAEFNMEQYRVLFSFGTLNGSKVLSLNDWSNSQNVYLGKADAYITRFAIRPGSSTTGTNRIFDVSINYIGQTGSQTITVDTAPTGSTEYQPNLLPVLQKDNPFTVTLSNMTSVSQPVCFVYYTYLR